MVLAGTSGPWYVAPWRLSGTSDLTFFSVGGSTGNREFWGRQGAMGDAGARFLMGVPVPTINTQPAGAGSGSAPVAGAYQYAVTLERTEGGYVSESGPVFSDTVTIATAQNVDIVMTKADTDIDTDYYTNISNMKFNLYRLYNGEYRLVNSTAVNSTTSSTTTLTDNVASASLTTVLPTYFQSRRTGDIVSYAIPITISNEYSSGMSEKPYSGKLFLWSGSVLHWCDTLKPSAWPSNFSTNFESNIRDVLIANNSAYVITSKGVYRTTSTDPEQMDFRPIFPKEDIFGWKGVSYGDRAYFFAEDGVYEISGESARNITQHIDPAIWGVKYSVFRNAVMGVFRERLYISVRYDNIPQKAINIVIDLQTGEASKWHDSTILYSRFDYGGYSSDGMFGLRHTKSGSYIENQAPELYWIGDVRVSPASMPWDWKSPVWIGDTAESGGFKYVEVQGSGTVVLETFVDGVSQKSKTLNFANRPGRILGVNFSKYNRSLQVKLSSSDGTGVVQELILVSAGGE